MISFICKPFYHFHIYHITLFLCSLQPHSLFARAQYVSDGDSDSDSNSIWNPLLMGVLAIVLIILFLIVYYIGYACFNRFCWLPEPEPNPPQRARGGLNLAILEVFPVFTYSNVAGLGPNKGPLECAVCLSPYEEEETLRLLPKCDHVFHLHCVDRWLAAHTTCPICRTDLVIPMPCELARVDSCGDDESGSRSGAEVVSNIQDDQLNGKIWRWNSTGHLAEIDRVEALEEDEVRFGLRSLEAVRTEFVTSNLIRSSSCIIALQDRG